MSQIGYENDLPSQGGVKSRVRWGAIFAGVISGMIVQVILSLFGLAIGFNAFDPGQRDYSGLGIGSTLWLLVSALISAYVGGWVASSLANVTVRLDGLMHGVLSWGVFMVIAAYMFGSSVGTVVGGAFNLTSSALVGASQGIAESATERTQGIAAVREQVGDIVQNVAPGNQAQSPATQRQRAVQAERAADTASTATWAAFFLALLSLAASAFGGLSGLRRTDYTASAT